MSAVRNGCHRKKVLMLVAPILKGWADVAVVGHILQNIIDIVVIENQLHFHHTIMMMEGHKFDAIAICSLHGDADGDKLLWSDDSEFVTVASVVNAVKDFTSNIHFNCCHVGDKLSYISTQCDLRKGYLLSGYKGDLLGNAAYDRITKQVCYSQIQRFQIE
jgi:hypothetical protein